MAPKSAAAQARKAAKAAAKAEKDAAKGISPPNRSPKKQVNKEEDLDDNRVCTGVLASRVGARDIKVDLFTMSVAGAQLVEECSIELTIGRRYGLIGANGSGKSNFLRALAKRDVPLPEEMDIFILEDEASPSDLTAQEVVVQHVREKLARLEQMVVEMCEVDPEDERLYSIYEQIEDLDPTKFEETAGLILAGLGFTTDMLKKGTKDMSGGWRMRVALARALFAAPTFLLLDEPTNHLDLEACVWLENYLAAYKQCLIVVSHSQDFLDGVCSHIIHLNQQTLVYYSGNYTIFRRTHDENQALQHKAYIKEQEEIKNIKQFISSCGTFSNLVKQAKSRQKVLDKMYEKGLTPPITKDRTYQIAFDSCEKLPPPVMPFSNVAFSYSGLVKDYLYTGVDLAIDSDSRVALVGPNGAGKSTLVKLMTGELHPSEGTIGRHQGLRLAKYHQHSADVLVHSQTPIEFFQERYPNNIDFKMDRDDWRKFLGRYGVSGPVQEKPIGVLSSGLHSRLVFAMMSLKKPNMILLDEPTNHMDMEMIDALAASINQFNGGVILISHDFRLLDQVAKEVWVCDNKKVEVFKGTIHDYKKNLVRDMVRRGLIKG